MFSVVKSRLLTLLETGTKASRRVLTGVRPATSRSADARRDATHLRDQEAFVELGRDTKLEHQIRADDAPHRKAAE